MKEIYQKENFTKIIQESHSIAEVMRKLGIRGGGSNAIVKKYIEKYKLDTSHFTDQLWHNGEHHIDKTSVVKLNECLKNNTNIKSAHLKRRLYQEGLKTEQCEICGCAAEWQGKPIVLELHHINGNHFDNRLENLQILCPNCHSLTETFGNLNKGNGKRANIRMTKEKLIALSSNG